MHFHKIVFAALLMSGVAGTAYAADSMSGSAKPAMTNGMSGPAMSSGMAGPKADAMTHPMKKKTKKKMMKKKGAMAAPMNKGMAGPSDGMAGPKAP
jgi:hypothetical protein